jgi:endonuclease/exonuclease/phosphatase family metal-dependent hydrolase
VTSCRAGPFFRCSPLWSETCYSPRAVPTVDLKVMSYNVGGHAALVAGRYLERIARVIERERPDVVGLQEVHRGTWLAPKDNLAA